jgi:hypothetical protein
MSSPTDKHEWRKHEKAVYLPKREPSLIELPAYKFITICGEGNPNSPHFPAFITALYFVAYGIKMTAKKKGHSPVGHYDYTVYPLEGVWDITEAAKKTFTGRINKDDLVFKLMLRQPDFVTASFFEEIVEHVKTRSPQALLPNVRFEVITEGRCIQMLHVGPYDDEPVSFQKMEAFASRHGLERLSKIHREIYLSDFRKVAPEKLKTVLRFQVR